MVKVEITAPVAFHLIKLFGKDFVEGVKHLGKKDEEFCFASTPDLKYWTTYGTIYSEAIDIKKGTERKYLLELGFVDVLKMPSTTFREKVIEAFLKWSRKVKQYEFTRSFYEYEAGKLDFELMVHESVLPSVYDKAIKKERKKLGVKLDPVLSKVKKTKKFKEPTKEEIETARTEGFKREIIREINFRDRKVVELAKRLKNGTTCAVCQFNFEKEFGAHGEGFIEMHHLHSIAHGERKTTVKDLRPVCSNCHRMLHRGKEILTINHLREIRKRAKVSNMK